MITFLISRYLEGTYHVSLATEILPQINTIVKKCLLGLKEELTTEGLGYYSFQLFGFDFMIDAQFHVWLLEVNGAPACAKALLPDLARDLVQKAIEPIFPTTVSTESCDRCKPGEKMQQTCKGFFKII